MVAAVARQRLRVLAVLEVAFEDRHEAVLCIPLGRHLLDAVPDDVDEPVGVDDDTLFQRAQRVILDRQAELGGFFSRQAAADVLLHDGGNRHRQPEGRAHLGADLAVLDVVRLGLAEIVEQRAAADQLHVDRRLAGGGDAPRDLQRLAGDLERVVEVLGAHARVLQQLDVGHVEGIVAALLANAVVVERLVARGGVLAPDLHELDVHVLAQVLDVLGDALVAVLLTDEWREVEHAGEVMALGFQYRIVDPGVQGGVVLAGAGQAGLQVLGGRGHGGLLEERG